MEVLQNPSLLETRNLNRYWRKKWMLGNQNHLKVFHQTLGLFYIPCTLPLYITLKCLGKRKSYEALCSWMRGYYHLQRKRCLLLIPKQRAELSLPSCQKPVNLHKHCWGLGEYATLFHKYVAARYLHCADMFFP